MRISGKVNGKATSWLKVKQNGSLTLSLKDVSVEVPMEAMLIQVAKLMARDNTAPERLARMTMQAQTGEGLAELAKEARALKV